MSFTVCFFFGFVFGSLEQSFFHLSSPNLLFGLSLRSHRDVVLVFFRLYRHFFLQRFLLDPFSVFKSLPHSFGVGAFKTST